MEFLFSSKGRKFLFATVAICFIIVGGVTAALMMLRQEAIDTHLKIAQLHARTLGDHLSQTLQSINLSAENIAILSKNSVDLRIIDQSLDEILRPMPYIRSLTLLDENGKAVAGTNQKNIGLTVRLDNFLPVPFLDGTMLRFGTPWKGRDISDGVEISADNKAVAKDMSFVPIIKEVPFGAKKYTLFITLNSDYFINRYSQSLPCDVGLVDVVRIDGVLLFSTDEDNQVGMPVSQYSKMFADIKDMFADVLNYNGKETLLAYQLSGTNPTGVVVRLDYKTTLEQWERQRINVLLITTALVIISATLALILLVRHKRQQAMEAQILKSKIAAMGELMGMIAHQWRQPLSIVSAIFSNITVAYEDGDLTKEYLDDANKQGREILKYMSKTIDDFRSFFKPQDSKELFCLCTATRDAVKLALNGLIADGITVYFNDKQIDENSLQTCQNGMFVSGYKNEFIQALISILKNSQEALNKRSGETKIIRIDLQEAESKYLLRFFDSGGGIEPSAMSRLFEPYFTTKHSSMGTGMGLYVAKVLIENNMGGKIGFENKDEGVLFTIELDKQDEKGL